MRLPIAPVRVLICMAVHSKAGLSCISVSGISNYCGMSNRSVIRAIKLLMEGGYIHRHRRGKGLTNMYNCNPSEVTKVALAEVTNPITSPSDKTVTSKTCKSHEEVTKVALPNTYDTKENISERGSVSALVAPATTNGNGSRINGHAVNGTTKTNDSHHINGRKKGRG